MLQRSPAAFLRRASLEAGAAVAAGAVVAWAIALAVNGMAAPSGRFLAGTYGVYGPAAVWVLVGVGRGHPFRHFGWPNGITLSRLVLSSVVGGIAVDGEAMPVGHSVAWAALALVGLALVLDGLDGRLARAHHRISPFGARFDMEVDALLILLLSLLAWTLGKAGPWVLLIGAMRYAFVAAGWLWPPLAAPLPPSFRRKAACVGQGLLLGAALVPPVDPPASAVAALVALLMLAWSFAADVRWLIRHRAGA